MSVRAAGAADAEAVAAIWNRAIRETTVTFNPVEKPVEEVAALIAEGRTFVWVTPEGAVAGFARWFQFRGGAGYRHTAEHTVMLSEAARGQGAGRGLMEAIFRDARAAGIHTIFAGCSAENPGAVTFHAAMGFARVATLPEVGFKFGRWIDLVLMQKRLHD